MTKRLKTIKASIVVGVLLFSLIAVFMPSGIAAPLKSNANLKLEYNASSLEEHVEPLGGPRPVTLEVGYYVSGIFARQAVSHFARRVLPIIELSVEDTPSYASAWIQPAVVYPELGTSWNTASTTLWVSFKEDVPARHPVTIKVKMKAHKIPGILYEIGGLTSYGDVSFTPGYLPIISVSTPKGNFQEISPGETANFDIEIENLGNAKTVVDFRILDMPKDWSPNMQSRVTLGAGALGDNPTTTVQLVVQPPYGFGYHNERQTIRVEITPSFFGKPGDPDVTGLPQVENFVIQSRGVSTPGFESAILIGALLGIVLIFLLVRKAGLPWSKFIKHRKQDKNKSK